MPSNHKIFGGVAVKFAPFKYIAGKRLYGSPPKSSTPRAGDHTQTKIPNVFFNERRFQKTSLNLFDQTAKLM